MIKVGTNVKSKIHDDLTGHVVICQPLNNYAVIMTDIIDYEMMTVECFLSDLEVRNETIKRKMIKNLLMTKFDQFLRIIYPLLTFVEMMGKFIQNQMIQDLRIDEQFVH